MQVTLERKKNNLTTTRCDCDDNDGQHVVYIVYL